jgi:hypothetical protein
MGWLIVAGVLSVPASFAALWLLGKLPERKPPAERGPAGEDSEAPAPTRDDAGARSAGLCGYP